MADLPHATKENEWLGFCPSAVKLQNGDRKGALKKRTDYQDSFSAAGVTTYCCSTKGCAFQSHVSVDHVWKAMMTDDKLGFKCRWAFLAKSHIQLGPGHGRQYQYQCPICIFEYGHAEGRIWRGTELFLDHVSTHRGKDLSSEVLHKLNIENSRVGTDKDDFDINLFPTWATSGSKDDPGSSGSSLSLAPTLSRASTNRSMSIIPDKVWNRKQSTASGAYGVVDAITRTHTNMSLKEQREARERADSVLTVVPQEKDEVQEPWSAGLSDFHMDKDSDYYSPDF